MAADETHDYDPTNGDGPFEPGLENLFDRFEAGYYDDDALDAPDAA